MMKSWYMPMAIKSLLKKRGSAMIIKNNELKRLLKEKGRRYTLMMYINRFFHMTNRQLDYVLRYDNKDEKREKEKTG